MFIYLTDHDRTIIRVNINHIVSYDAISQDAKASYGGPYNLCNSHIHVVYKTQLYVYEHVNIIDQLIKDVTATTYKPKESPSIRPG